MQVIGDFVEAFEQARTQGPADLAPYLPQGDHPLYAEVLRELIRVDLEYGWERGQPRPLEGYCREFPAIVDDRAGLEAIAFEEYRLRHQAGEQPTPEEYRRSFGVSTGEWPRFGSRTGGGAARGSSVETASWTALDRLLRKLPHCQRSAEQVPLALETVRDCLAADAVFWYPNRAGERTVVVGRPLEPEWCASFAAERLALFEEGESQKVYPALPTNGSRGPSPRSALLLRLGGVRSAWIVALRFEAGQSFGDADLERAGLVRRILLNQRRQVRAFDTLKTTLFQLVQCLTVTIDARDPYTYGHSERVARVAVRLGQELGLPPPAVSDLYLAGLLHDIGKIGIDDSLLRKPGKLTPDEFRQVQAHVTIGDRIISTIQHFSNLRPGVRHHHEAFDGTGYPDRLAGPAIPRMARVLAVADAFDAMLYARPYRSALPAARVETILREGAGRRWDPEVVDCFFACRAELYPICQEGIGSSVLAALQDALGAVGLDSLTNVPSVTRSQVATPSGCGSL